MPRSYPIKMLGDIEIPAALGSRYIYAIHNPDIVYVGTAIDVRGRFKVHLKRWPEASMSILEYAGVGDHNYISRERWWIAEMRHRGHVLENIA